MASGLYQQRTFREAAGSELRPGGLALTGALVQECGLSPGQRVLDVGCGVGSSASFLAHNHGLEVTGLDECPEFIDEARGRHRGVVWMLGDASSLPFPDGSFDAVLCECVLSLMDDPAVVLGEIRRVLRQGGQLALSDMYLRNPDALALGPRPAQGCCLCGALPLDDLTALVEGAGLHVQLCEDRSQTLGSLVASLIFAYGSAEHLWDSAFRGEHGSSRWLTTVRPGYLILVATAP